jgi:hypothetical protein
VTRFTIKNTSVLWGLVTATALFIPFAWFTPRQEAFEIMNAMLGAFGFFVVIACAERVYQVMKLPAHALRASHILMTAVSITCACLSVAFGTWWIWRAFPDMHWVIDSWWTLFTRWGLLVAFTMFMATTLNEEGIITLASYKRLALLFAGALLLSVVLVTIGDIHD